jgi:hypothetical protein
MTTRSRIATFVGLTSSAALLAAGLPLALAGPAAADAETHGTCSASSRWDFDVEREDGGYEVSFEVDSYQPGDRWKLQLSQNGTRFLSEVHVTDGEGEVDVERWRSNEAGRDVFKARGVNQSTGETCTATIRRA